MNESVDNWADLESRDKVRLDSEDHIVATGSVDGVMPDGSALWLVQDAFFERALFLKSDGLGAVRMSEQTSPSHTPSR